MDAQYLDAHKFLATLKEQNVEYTETLLNLMQYAVIEDVAPVVHAHWVDNGEPYCSRCEWSPAPEWSCIEDLQLADVYYCPHCGAKMDEKGGGE